MSRKLILPNLRWLVLYLPTLDSLRKLRFSPVIPQSITLSIGLIRSEWETSKFRQTLQKWREAASLWASSTIEKCHPAVQFERLPEGQFLQLPHRATEDAAGLDLQATRPGALLPGERAVIGTGFNVAIPRGYVGLVCPRSGLARAWGVGIVNAPGVIDADFRGEIQVLLVNHGRSKFMWKFGDRIAQLVVLPVSRVRSVEVKSLTQTKRGKGGFGSTGKG